MTTKQRSSINFLSGVFKLSRIKAFNLMAAGSISVNPLLFTCIAIAILNATTSALPQESKNLWLIEASATSGSSSDSVNSHCNDTSSDNKQHHASKTSDKNNSYSSNYLYVLNENQNDSLASSAPSSASIQFKNHSLTTNPQACDNSSFSTKKQSGHKEDNEDGIIASASSLKFLISSSNSSSSSSSGSSAASASGTGKKPDANQDRNSDEKRADKKQSKSGFFKGHSKLSISGLLPKSKRQDSSFASKNDSTRSSAGQRSDRRKPPAPSVDGIQARMFPNQAHQFALPYAATGGHLLFGSPLSLPAFFEPFRPSSGDDMLAVHSAARNQLAQQPRLQHIQSQQSMAQPSFHQALAAHPLADFHQHPRQGELRPILFPAGAADGRPTSMRSHAPAGNRTNTSFKSQRAAPAVAPASNSSGSAPAPSGFTGLPLGAAAAALFSERAKNFISQLNRAGALSRKKELASQQATRGAAGPKKAPEQHSAGAKAQAAAGQQAPGTPAHQLKGQPDQEGVASMVAKGPGEQYTWLGSATSSADVAPSIIVEHEGPAIATVDFGPPAQPQQQPPPPPPPMSLGQRRPDADGDEDVSTYYDSSEDEESEMEGGSHDSRRIVKLKPNGPFPLYQAAGLSRTYPSQRAPAHRGELSSAALPAPQLVGPLNRSPGFAGQLQPAPPFGAPRIRYPFNQVDQSHIMQVELPQSDGYPDYDYGPAGRKRGFGASGSELPSSVLQDYMNHQRQMAAAAGNHAGAPPPLAAGYPDSINAIKEQSGGGGGGGSGPAGSADSGAGSSFGSKLSASTNDQIEQLIQELRKLNKRKQSEASQSESGAGSAAKPSKQALSLAGSSSSSTGGKGADDDDYDDDLFGSSGSSAAGDDSEEQRMRLLRRKLLSRLRSKTRKRGQSAHELADSFHNEAIKIPLHTLLLAALDRRMSSSEQAPATVASDSQAAGGEASGAAEGRRRPAGEQAASNGAGSASMLDAPAAAAAAAAQQQASQRPDAGRHQEFGELSSGLLASPESLAYGANASGTSSSVLAGWDQQSLMDNVTNMLLRDGLHESLLANTTASLTAAGLQKDAPEYVPAAAAAPNMFILNNIRLPDQLSFQQRSSVNESQMAAAASTDSPGRSVRNERAGHRQPEAAELEAPAQADSRRTESSAWSSKKKTAHRQRARAGTSGRARTSGEASETREPGSESADQEDQEADFERLNRQVDEFTRETGPKKEKAAAYESPEPQRARSDRSRKPRFSAGGAAKRMAPVGDWVHFDDESEGDGPAGASRGSKVLKRRRQPPKESGRQKAGEEEPEGGRFLDEIQATTSMESSTDVDRNLADMEEPTSDERSTTGSKAVHANGTDSELEPTGTATGGRLSIQVEQQEVSAGEEPNAEEQEERQLAASNNWNQQQQSPQTIDYELQKIEKIANQHKAHQKRDKTSSPSAIQDSGDYSDLADPTAQMFEEAVASDQANRLAQADAEVSLTLEPDLEAPHAASIDITQGLTKQHGFGVDDSKELKS